MSSFVESNIQNDRENHLCKLVENGIHKLLCPEDFLSNWGPGPAGHYDDFHCIGICGMLPPLVESCPTCQLFKRLLPPSVFVPSYQGVFIDRSTSIRRVEPEIGESVTGERNLYEDYAKIAYISVRDEREPMPSRPPEVFSLVGQGKGLAPTPVHPQAVPPELVHRWVNLCIEKHTVTCRPETFPQLSSINLIDVQESRLVEYCDIVGTAERIDYLCLSYVWGDPSPEVWKVEGKVLRVPATIQDAMTCTKRMGKRYVSLGRLGK